MAFLTQAYKPTSADTAVSFFSMIKTDVAKYVLYRKTISELNRLSNHDLSDIGLSRSGIKATAKEAVYKN